MLADKNNNHWKALIWVFMLLFLKPDHLSLHVMLLGFLTHTNEEVRLMRKILCLLQVSLLLTICCASVPSQEPKAAPPQKPEQAAAAEPQTRSEEHTSELQSP